MEIKFEFEKETKGTLRFTEISEDPKIGTLYIKKSALKELGVSDKDTLILDIRKA